MEESRAYIIEKLNDLRLNTSSDFSAFACLNKNTYMIHWNFVSGNLNERYKHMQGRPGKGLAGFVIRADRPIVLDDSLPDIQTKRLEYPIMLAEKLHAAVAVPVKVNGKTEGVLLVGSRIPRIYSEEDIKFVANVAFTIALEPKQSNHHKYSI